MINVCATPGVGKLSFVHCVEYSYALWLLAFNKMKFLNTYFHEKYVIFLLQFTFLNKVHYSLKIILIREIVSKNVFDCTN